MKPIYDELIASFRKGIIHFAFDEISALTFLIISRINLFFRGEVLRIGICTPPGADVEIQSLFPAKSGKDRLITRSRFTRVNSLAELDAMDPDLDGKKYYLDDATG